MKKIVILCFTGLFISISSFSQTKGYIGISFGPGIPYGEFASTDAADESSGYAMTGLAYDLSFVFKFSKYFGISAFLSRQTNPIDTHGFVGNAAAFNAVDNIKVSCDNWKLNSYMFGVYFSTPILEKLDFESRAVFGFISTRALEIKVDFYESGIPLWGKMNQPSALSFSFMLGTGFRYNVAKRICVLFNFDYQASNPKYDTSLTRSDLGLFNVESYHTKLESVIISAGIGYRF